MEGAGRTVNNAFDIFGNVLKQREQQDAAAATNLQETNKQTYLDRLASAKTPEELAALQQGGELDALRAALSPQARAAVRGQEDTALVNLRNQVTQRLAFEDSTLARQRMPKINEAKALIAAGRYAEAQSILDKEDLGDESGLATGIKTGQRGDKEFQFKVADEAHKAAARPLELEGKKVSIEAGRNSIAASRASVAAAEEQRKLAADQRLQAQVAARAAANVELLSKMGNSYASGVFDPNSTGDLMKMMTDNGIGDDVAERTAIVKRVSNLREFELPYTDPTTGKTGTRKVPVPLGVVREAILGSQDQWFNMKDEGWANEVEKNIRKRMTETVMMRDGAGKEVAVPKVAFDLDQYLQTRMQAAENPLVSKKK